MEGIEEEVIVYMGPDRICKQCGAEFVATRYNQIFCKNECREINNNEMALARYYERKKEKKNPTRKICKIEGCTTILSRYNKTKICEAHKRSAFIERMTKWGFDPVEAEQHWLIND